MIAVQSPSNFDDWRRVGRGLLAQNVSPHAVTWCADGQQSLFGISETEDCGSDIRVPREFVKLARIVACHTDARRWELLYEILWRVTHGEPKLLGVASDPAIRAAQLLGKAVARDIHKMHAFVRFKRIVEDGTEHFAAWYRPDFRVLRVATPFFARRFGSMRWAIFTPFGSVSWDLEKLCFDEQAAAGCERPTDDVEDLWRSYYRSIFNPARSNAKLMTKEMPRRFWKDLPEADTIRELLKESGSRLDGMIQQQRPSIRYDLEKMSLESIHHQLPHCRACPLYASATNAVAGEGSKDARVVLVGEQPGNEEDLTGRPFVGPAGEMLNRALAALGVSRSDLYITNAVKHFKFEMRGKVRLHKRASLEEARVCSQWLNAELNALNLKIIIALGRTAAHSLLGREVKIGTERGRVIQSSYGPVVVTYHPSALLRASDPSSQREMFDALVADLRLGLVEAEALQSNFETQGRTTLSSSD
ncbi:MAG: UdgX family uracil-DNA binding protein [Bdellovibrionota bacterium]